MFASYQVNIPQSCEQCLSYIWLMDKALLCSGEPSPVLATWVPYPCHHPCLLLTLQKASLNTYTCTHNHKGR